MIDPKKTAEMDQDIARLAEFFPRLWKRIYDGCLNEGFTEFQSLELVKAYIQMKVQS